ncbi:MAG: hypothetical protein FGM33_08670, partial [Candidatus Kapabacteria bacterium]|nr:hypothetical protein [Candidatus Kapabacteria bacterium]
MRGLMIVAPSVKDDPLTRNQGVSIFASIGVTGGGYDLVLPSARGTQGQVLGLLNGTSGSLVWITPLTAETGWMVTGNDIPASGGGLGQTATGGFFGTKTTSTSKDLRLVTNGLVRIIVTSAGQLQTTDILTETLSATTSVTTPLLTTTGNLVVQTTDASTINFNTNGSERLRIASDGFVSITNNASIGGSLSVTGLITGSSGGSITGATNINTSGNANTTIGNATGTGTTTINTNGASGQLVITNLVSPSTSTNDVLLIGSGDQVTRITQANLFAGQGWALVGNTGTSSLTNFIGTRDGVDFVTRTNNIERMRVTSGGLVLIGTTTGTNTLEVSGTGRFTGLLTGDGGATITGGTINLNDGSNNATNINTGTSAGVVTIGGTANQTIDIGTSNGGIKTVSLGSTNGSSITTLNGGSSLNINSTGAGLTNIGDGTSSGAITIGGGGAQTISIGTGAANKTVLLGSTNGTSATTLMGGSGGLNLNTSNNANTNINTGT